MIKKGAIALGVGSRHLCRLQSSPETGGHHDERGRLFIIFDLSEANTPLQLECVCARP